MTDSSSNFFNNRMLCVLNTICLLISISVGMGLSYTQYPISTTTNWVLMGGLTESSVSFRVRKHNTLKRLIVTTDAGLSSSVFNSSLPMNVTENQPNNYVYHATVADLLPETPYFYATLDASGKVLAKGQFETAPVPGVRSSFQFLASGCSWTASKNPIYDIILQEHPDALFFAHLGDFHYKDLNTSSVEERIQAVDNVLYSDPQRNLFSNKPMVYMWDDHDWLGNNAGAEYGTKGREAALESYRQAFPYYDPLPSAESMYQAFTIGTVRFILTDLRSEATSTNMYSDDQREWLKGELSQASSYDFVVWFTTKPWIGKGSNPEESDSWKGYPDDREELSAFISENVPNNLLAISSDAHMVGLDDGSNTYYGASLNETTKSFPILQTGPMDRIGSVKGGPYSEGVYTNTMQTNNQYSTISFQESSDGQACLEIESFRINDLGKKEQILSKKFCGGDIFATPNPGVGSDSAKLLSTVNMALFVTGMIFLFCATIMPCFWGRGIPSALLTSTIVFLFCVATLVAGMGIPFVRGINMVFGFPIFLLFTLQTFAVVIYLFFWRRTQKND